jgi:Txe/YoeB family toxin of Txe-Axe toxin-antitoxin module
VAAFEGLKKFKMAAVAMVTKVQKMLNSLQTADPFEIDTKIDHHSKLCSLFL